MNAALPSLDLNITVQDMRKIWGQASTGQTRPGQINLTPLHARLVELFERWLGMDRIDRQEDLEALGSLLFQILFDGPLFGLYEELRRQAGPGQRLRLQLGFQEAAFEIAGYPWEFLYVPETETRRGYFMATEASIVLSRYMPLDAERLADLKPVMGPLTILVVVSSPGDLHPVIAPPVIEALTNLAQDHGARLIVEKAPTADRFLQVLRDNQPQVLHFLGHGQFNAARQRGEVALLADDGAHALWVPDRLFADYFQQMDTVPRLVFLHSCQGGANQFQARFAGLAPQLVRANIQAVIAMQYPINNGPAIQFAKAFYRELAGGAPVDSAAQAGRLAITSDPNYAHANRVFGTPMLWMRSRSGVIL